MSNDTMTPLKNAVRVFNKHVLNPVMMNLAGRKHWYAAVIRHTGRRSGKSYATPVVADRVADGFILPLPYGTGVDWLRNVLAAGRATVTVGRRDVRCHRARNHRRRNRYAAVVAASPTGLPAIRHRQLRETEAGEIADSVAAQEDWEKP